MWWRLWNQRTWRRGEAVMKIECVDTEEGVVVAMNATTVLPVA